MEGVTKEKSVNYVFSLKATANSVRKNTNQIAGLDHSTGEFYNYSYDTVGNRLTEQTHLETNAYVYDDANRLISVDSVNYTFDANGNLLNDGTSTYAYDSANRLSSVNNTEFYTYNGLGDRLTQNGIQYTVDLNAGLTQVIVATIQQSGKKLWKT